MAVVDFDRIHNGRGGETVIAGDKVIKRYADVYRATTDSNTTEATDVQADARCPTIGSVCPHDAAAFCRSVKPNNIPLSKQVWLVTVGYSTETEMDEDPLAEPARITWRTEAYQKPVIRDLNGVAHTNTASDAFDPPEMMDDSRWVATVRKNVDVVPTWLLSYRDVVNNAEFILDGLTIPLGWAKLSAIEIGEEQERNDIEYRVLTMTIQLAEMYDTSGMVKWDAGAGSGSGSGAGAYVALGASEFEHAHAAITLNIGLYQRTAAVAGSGSGSGSGASAATKIPCIDSDENPASIPMLLAMDGGQIGYSAGTLTPPDPDEALYVVSDVYNTKPFSVLPLT